MATVSITLASVSGASSLGGSMPVPDAEPLDQDVVASAAGSAQSNITCETERAFWVITVTGGNVFVKFGANPTASAADDGGWLILDGQTREFAATNDSQKCAVIDA